MKVTALKDLAGLHAFGAIGLSTASVRMVFFMFTMIFLMYCLGSTRSFFVG